MSSPKSVFELAIKSAAKMVDLKFVDTFGTWQHFDCPVADQAFIGPEAEFFIFDNVQYDGRGNCTFYSVECDEAVWKTGGDEMPNLGNKIRHCLEKVHAFLLKGGVCTSDFIDLWITAKRKEHDAIRLRSQPHEFFLYDDV
jgi:glutamine synthetase